MQRFVPSLFRLVFQKRELVGFWKPEPVQPKDTGYDEGDPEAPSPRFRAMDILCDKAASDWALQMEVWLAHIRGCK